MFSFCLVWLAFVCRHIGSLSQCNNAFEILVFFSLYAHYCCLLLLMLLMLWLPQNTKDHAFEKKSHLRKNENLLVFFSPHPRDWTFDELLNEWLHSTTSDKNPVDYRDIGLMGNEWKIIYMDIDFSVLYEFEFWIYNC